MALPLRLLSLAILLLAVGLGGCDARATAPEPAEPVRTLALDVDRAGVRSSSMVAEGASEAGAREALARIVAWRLGVLGLPGTVTDDEAGLVVTFAAEVDGVRARRAAESLASLGRCEIFVEASEDATAAQAPDLAAWRSAHPGRPFEEHDADPDRPARDLAWFPRRPPPGDQRVPEPVLVQLPRTPAEAFGSSDFARVHVTADRLGYPAIGFDVRDERVDDFRAFTSANVGRRLNIVVAGRVVVRATLATELSRSGLIEGHFEGAEVDRIVQDLAPGRALVKPR